MPKQRASISVRLTLFFAVACGLIVANIYYAQPLAGLISHEFGMEQSSAGLIVTITQAGYGLGLLFIVPLGDLLENRRLVTTVLTVSAAGLLIIATTSSGLLLLAACLLTGIGSATVQILVPFAAALAPVPIRGKVVGSVVSGLMLGIMLARPLSSFLTDLISWRAIFWFSGFLMLIFTVVLLWALPRRKPETNLTYGSILVSLATIAATTPPLRRRAAYRACMFGAFSLFWTSVPLYLSGPFFALTQSGIALFAFVGVAGAAAASLAGRLADKGLTHVGTGCAMLLLVCAFALTLATSGGGAFALFCLTTAAVILDFAVSAELVFSQRVIFSLPAELHSRLNGLLMAAFFCSGALCSAIGTWIYSHFHWHGVAGTGILIGTIALAYFMTEDRNGVPKPHSHAS